MWRLPSPLVLGTDAHKDVRIALPQWSYWCSKFILFHRISGPVSLRHRAHGIIYFTLELSTKLPLGERFCMLLLLSELIGGGGDEIVPEHQVLGEWGTWGCTGEGF